MTDIRDYRWTVVYINSRDPDNPEPIGIYVYRDVNPDGSHSEDILFFGNSIAHFAGHKNPHQYIQNLPDRYKRTAKHAHGTFLDVEGVRYVAAHDQFVLDWLDGYITKCNAIDPATQTGFSPIETRNLECPD
jgi:hypothetical protein